MTNARDIHLMTAICDGRTRAKKGSRQPGRLKIASCCRFARTSASVAVASHLRLVGEREAVCSAHTAAGMVPAIPTDTRERETTDAALLLRTNHCRSV